MELEGAGDNTLQAAGVCSGDTLWLMTPSDQKSSGAPSNKNVEPAVANSFSAAAAHPLGAPQTHEGIAALSEASAQLPTVRDPEDDTVQHPALVRCSNYAAMSRNFAARLQKDQVPDMKSLRLFVGRSPARSQTQLPRSVAAAA